MFIGNYKIDGVRVSEFIGPTILFFCYRYLYANDKISLQSFDPELVETEDLLKLDSLSDAELQRIPRVGPERKERLRRAASEIRRQTQDNLCAE